MSAQPLKKIVVVGGSGAAGAPIVRALVEAMKFEVSVPSRAGSQSTFPEGVNVIKTDYTHDKLVAALKGQDVVISTITTFSVDQQQLLIDASVEARVRRFLPSEFGVDTSDPSIGKLVPPTGVKNETVAYLKTKESSGLSWTAVIVGAFFDWVFDQPGVLGWNLPEKCVTIFDGGDVEFEATNLAQIGRSVVAILERPEETANQYVYVNSFTTTQNKMLKAFEELSGEQFKVTHANTEDYSNAAQEKIRSDPGKGAMFVQGGYEAIILIMLNHRGYCEYSKTKGLWNKRLGLPEEKLEDTVRAVLAKAAA
ncbi:nmrA-like family protein [Cladophialophora carrionii]|uniref:NmrA-like family protein n=1 Tax=Cladophialophora carrionii TaxID=86049 RepID=A0A1C1CRC5_9EURO|nr:nmrA-like family protein [Cladophialophora carrionii]